MEEPVWKLIPIRPLQPIRIVWREWPDGKQESCLVTEPKYLDWLAKGNEPLPADNE